MAPNRKKARFPPLETALNDIDPSRRAFPELAAFPFYLAVVQNPDARRRVPGVLLTFRFGVELELICAGIARASRSWGDSRIDSCCPLPTVLL